MRLGMRSTLGLALAAACGGPAGSFRGGVYHEGAVHFRVGPLQGWERVRVRGNDLSFYRDDLGAVIAVNGECDSEKDPPLRTLAMQSLIGFTDREVRLEELIPLDRREAMHMVVDAKLDGVPRTISLYVLKKDECLYDFTFVSPPARHDGTVADFDRFVLGFEAIGDGTR